MQNIATVLANVNGNSFVGLDTEVIVPLTGGRANNMQGRVTKRTTGSQVMVFQNKNTNGYEAMVQRRLVKEGKNPASFQLSPRKWGTRIPNTPIVEHTPAKEVNPKHYLEVIFLKAGTSEYFLDGQPIAKDQINGLKADPEPTGQGGLEDQVIIRTYDVASLTKVRIDGAEFVGPFFYA